MERFGCKLSAEEDEYHGLSIEKRILFWKKNICNTLFVFFSITGGVVLIPSVYVLVKEESWFLVILDTFIYLVALTLTLKRNSSYRLRVYSAVFLLYLLGVLLLFNHGSFGSGGYWLFSFSLMVGIFLGEKWAVRALILNCITLLISNLLLFFPISSLGTFPNFGGVNWLINSINFIFLNAIIVFFNSLLIDGFNNLLRRMVQTNRATILGLAKLAEYRDNDTGDHLRRIQTYAGIIAESLYKKKSYKGYVTREFIEDIQLSSILHDIGKVGINDNILLKPGKLTKDEFDIIKQHPLMGGDVVQDIEKGITGRSFYTLGKEIVYYHHEKWDGTGYPEGLKGESIPLSARIIALVDVYDALTTKRPYKEAFSHERTRSTIIDGRGKHFDPDIVDVFLENEDQFLKVLEGDSHDL